MLALRNNPPPPASSLAVTHTAQSLMDLPVSPCPTLCTLVRVPLCTCVPQVRTAIANARVAQQQWGKTTFAQRKRVIRMIQKFVLANQEAICQVSMLDSGKTRACPLPAA